MSTSPFKVPMTNQGHLSSPRGELICLLGSPTEQLGRSNEVELRQP